MNTNMETDNIMETSSLPILPEDVLLDIFEFLKTRDRNNAKLVCKSWLRLLRRTCLTHREAFFFAEYHDFSTIVTVVDECCRDELNLKFQNRRILQNSNVFWKKCGHKIKSLIFCNCSFHPDVMLQIFEHCVNLEEFVAAEFCGIISHRKRRPMQSAFRQFKVNHLLRKKLLTLELGALPLSVSDLICIASVFPNLKTLGVSLGKNMNVYFSTLQNLLETQMLDIETLSVRFQYSDVPGGLCSIQKFISSSRASRVTFFLRIQPELFTESNISWISSLKFMTSLTIQDDRYDIPVDMTRLASFIAETPMLGHLQFCLSLTTINSFCTIMSALVESRLILLQTTVRFYTCASRELRNAVSEIHSSLDGLTRNYSVRNLEIHSQFMGEEFNSLFLKYFRGVYDLRMEAAVDPTTVFKYQTQLKSLVMEIVPSKNVISSPISIESLESLDIVNNHTDLVELFSLYRFPNLKHLILQFSNDLYESRRASQEENFRGKTVRDLLKDDLQKLASILLLESPKLEGVDFFDDTDEMEMFEFFLQFCRNFRHLRYICLKSDSCVILKKNELLQEIIKHVTTNSSVKVVAIHTNDFRIFYVFNPVKGEYELVSSSHVTCNVFYPVMKDLWANTKYNLLGMKQEHF